MHLYHKDKAVSVV